MKKALIISIVLGVLALIAGCQSNYINQPTSLLNVNAEVKVEPIVSIGEKIEGTAAVTRTLFIFVHGPGKFAEGVNYGNNYYKDQSVSTSIFSDVVVMAKAAAAYRACAENKADFIICPRYVVSVSDYFLYKKVVAKVTGYKGVLRELKLPENKVENNNNQFEKSFTTMTEALEGIKKNTQDLVEKKQEEPNKEDIQKDIKKDEETSEAGLSLDSKIDFEK